MANASTPVVRADVDKARSDYATMLPLWQRCQHVLSGQDAVKAQGTLYLPKLDGQTTHEYDAYKSRALFYNAVERTRFALVGSVFRKDTQVEAPSIVDDDLQDINLDGTPVNDFSLSVLEEVVGVGRCGVLVDMPDDKTPIEDRRPYWQMYEATQILNWRRARRGALFVTSLLVLEESIEEPDPKNTDNTCVEKQYRRFELVDVETLAPHVEITVWQKIDGENETDKGKFRQVGETVRPQRRGKALDFIPFQFINASSLLPDIEKPPLLDMVDVNLSHYRSSADLEHGEHYLGLPTPWVVGLPDAVASIPLGPTNVLKLKGQNASAGLLEFKGEGLKQLESALTRKQEMMAVLGARLIDPGQRSQKEETAESVKAKNAATHATLSKMVNTVSNALTQILRWHVWWRGVDTAKETDIKVALNKDFIDPQMTADDVKAEVLRWQSGACSFETLYFNLTRGGRTRPGVTAETEKADIDGEENDRAAALALVKPPAPAPDQNQPPAKTAKPGGPQA